MLEEKSYDGIWDRRGGEGDRLSPLGTYDSLLRPDWLHASPLALHCIHGVEKKLVLPKTSRQPIRRRAGG